MLETWKPIANFEDYYEVSDKGRIRSNYTNKVLTPRPVRGYLTVALYKDGKAHNKQIHRLVADAFIPNLETKAQVNHIDGDKTNNSVFNLEWVTPRENNVHAYHTGLKHQPSGERSHRHKLTAIEVAEIRKLYIPRHKEFGCTALGKKYGVSHQHISELVHYKKWK